MPKHLLCLKNAYANASQLIYNLLLQQTANAVQFLVNLQLSVTTKCNFLNPFCFQVSFYSFTLHARDSESLKTLIYFIFRLYKAMEFSPTLVHFLQKKLSSSEESTLQTPLATNSKKGIICQTVGVGI